MLKTKELIGPQKVVLRSAYRLVIAIHTFFTAPLSLKKTPRIFYAGARSGNLGGTLVKIKRLQEYFPQSNYFYNIVYSLSNAPYLSQSSLNWLTRFKVPIVVNQNGVFYPGWYVGDWKEQNRLMSYAYHKADYVFWQSQFCRRCADQFLGERSGPGEVLFNSVDIDIFKPSATIVSRPFTFLVAGKTPRNLSYRIESSIKSIFLARKSGLDVRLLIAGSVQERERLQALVASYSLTDYIDFIGAYTQEEAPLIFQSADAYLSLTFQDSCPNSVIEAMACGLPILYSCSGGVPELVGQDSGVGLEVRPDWSRINVPSEDLILSAMFEIYHCSRSMALAARKRAVELFDIRHWIKRHEEIFFNLTSL